MVDLEGIEPKEVATIFKSTSANTLANLILSAERRPMIWSVIILVALPRDGVT